MLASWAGRSIEERSLGEPLEPEGSNIVYPVLEPPLSPTGGRVEGEVKVSVSYRNSNLFIMVMHIRDLVRAPTTSDPLSTGSALTGAFLYKFLYCLV